MGTFSYPVIIPSSSGDTSEQVEALVDTGSTYMWLPSPVLERLGYQPVTTRVFILATGEQIERGLTAVQVRIGDETWPVPCVVGNEGSLPLLGAMVLEAFSLAVDPVNQRLVPTPSLAMRVLEADIKHIEYLNDIGAMP